MAHIGGHGGHGSSHSSNSSGRGSLLGFLLILPILLFYFCVIKPITWVFDSNIVIENTETVDNNALKSYKKCFFDDENHIVINILITHDKSNGYYLTTVIGDNISSNAERDFSSKKIGFINIFEEKVENMDYSKALIETLKELTKKYDDKFDFNGYILSNGEGKLKDFQYRYFYKDSLFNATYVPQSEPVFINESQVDLEENDIKKAINDFYENTGLSLGVVFQNTYSVLSSNGLRRFFGILILSVETIVVVIIIILVSKKKKENKILKQKELEKEKEEDELRKLKLEEEKEKKRTKNYCNSCGNVLNPKDLFCDNCGAKIEK